MVEEEYKRLVQVPYTKECSDLVALLTVKGGWTWDTVGRNVVVNVNYSHYATAGEAVISCVGSPPRGTLFVTNVHTRELYRESIIWGRKAKSTDEQAAIVNKFIQYLDKLCPLSDFKFGYYCRVPMEIVNTKAERVAEYARAVSYLRKEFGIR